MASYDAATFRPDISIGYLSKHIHQSAHTALEKAFEGENISFLQWAAMVSIHHGRGATCKDLAHDLARDRGATTRLIDSLEELCLAERQRDSDDRRIVNLALTDAGRALVQRCMIKVIDLWNGWLEGWDPADVARLIADLQRLRQTLEAATEDN